MKIKGSIQDGKTYLPVEGVRIELSVSGQQIAVLSSDRNGRFEKGVNPELSGGTISWAVEQDGYISQQGSLQADKEEIPLDVALDPKVVEGDVPVQLNWWQRKQTWYIVIAASLLLVVIAIIKMPGETKKPVREKPAREEPVIEEPGSVAPDKVKVPNVKGYYVKKAKKSLRQAGFVNVEIKERYSRETAPGNVLFTKPEAGSIVALSSAIRLVVATDVKSNKTLCGEWCNDSRNSCQCKHEKHGCDVGFNITKRFSEGIGDDWYACRRQTSQLSYMKMDFGYNGCNVKFGALRKGISESDMIRLATKADAKGFTYHPSLEYGKLMIGDYPAGCKSSSGLSWPLYLKDN